MSCCCLVTPDTIGPVKNGGIGTHCYFLACHLVRQGHEVSLLLTIPVGQGDKEHWEKFYASKGINLLYLHDYPDLPCPVHLGPDLRISLKVFEVLRQQHFDQLHFQDWRAHGFHCIQAKQTLGAFKDTLLTVTAHSCTEWIDEGMGQWNSRHTEGSKLVYAERYAIAHADVLICPSVHMRMWLVEHGYVLPADCRIIQYIYTVPKFADHNSVHKFDGSTIAFFGRLETRKGLAVFCQALRCIAPDLRDKIRHILFVGKEGICDNLPSNDYIDTHLAEFTSLIELHTDLDAFAAQALLCERNALVCIPSLADNLPYAVIECAVQGIPALSSRVGGIPEILPDTQLFDPTPASLAAALTEVLEQGFPSYVPPVYDAQRACSGWDALAQYVPSTLPTAVAISEPRISICVAHYNHGAYLPQALASLAAQEYSNFEVLVVDDGSTDQSSRDVFEHLRETLDARFRFFTKSNTGLGATRNFCVRHATGEFLVFCDSDNVFMPHMLRTFAGAVAHGGADALTCHTWHFVDELKPVCRYAPMGSDLSTGLLENVFGDANFLVKKSVFDDLNGFVESRHGCEDWEFLARLTLSGYKLDVIPEPLFWYRLNPSGLRSTMSLYHSHQLVFSAYKKHLPPFAIQACSQLLLPMFCGHSVSNAVIIRTMLRLGIALEEKYTRLFPAGSWGQRICTVLWHKITSLLPKKRAR